MNFKKLETVKVNIMVSLREKQGSVLRRLAEGLDKSAGGFAVTKVVRRKVTLVRKFDEVQKAVDDLDGYTEPERYQGC